MSGLFLVFLARYLNFTQDDAYITFRYAANYVSGHGLVYNVGERVEGYTNFLWTIFMINGRQVGLDLVLFSKLLGTLFGLGTLFFVFLMARRLFENAPPPWQNILPGLSALMVGSAWSFAYWTVAGLETAAFACAVTAAIYYYLTRSYLVIPALVAATLFRPEGGLVFVILIGFETIAGQKLSRYAVVMAILYALFLTPLAIFKLLYYGDLLPNPFYAKTSLTTQQIVNGIEYAGQYFWHYVGAGLFLIPLLLVWKRWDRPIRLMAIFVLVYTLYIILIGGDVLKVHRFFAPIMPILAIIAVWGISILLSNRLLVLGVVIALFAWQSILPYKHVRTFHRQEMGMNHKMESLMDNLLTADQSNFSLAVSVIGYVGYRLLGHQVIDLLGLTDSTIARHPEPLVPGMETTWRETQFNSQYILTRQPNYILFSTGIKASAPAERSLFLYSQFLHKYRTIGFHFSSQLHQIYKRYMPITEPVTRDIDPEFERLYNLGIRLYARKLYRESLDTLQQALNLSPEPKYPYVYSFMALSADGLKDNAGRLAYTQASISDTLVAETPYDLFFYEYNRGNLPLAREYRDRVAKLTPWFVADLDNYLRKRK